MLTPILIVIIVISITTSTWFFSQLKSKKSSISKLEIQVESLSQDIDLHKSVGIKASAEKEGLERILEIEKAQSITKQKELTLQLELVGREIISQGNKALKAENEEQLKQILTPLKEKLEKFELKVTENKEYDIERFANMETLIKTLSEQHSKMHDTAQNLVNALRGEQKTQGDWGELALERILEFSGLEKGREYHVQPSYQNDKNERLRPDVVINLPEDKHIIIDAKVSLKAFVSFQLP